MSDINSIGAGWDPSLKDDDRSSMLYISIAIATFLIVSTTTARIATKLAYNFRLGYDDYFILFGTVC